MTEQSRPVPQGVTPHTPILPPQARRWNQEAFEAQKRGDSRTARRLLWMVEALSALTRTQVMIEDATARAEAKRGPTPEERQAAAEAKDAVYAALSIAEELP